MSRFVLDASVVLALLHEEPGAESVTAELWSDSTISAINLAEVLTNLIRRGVDPDKAWEVTLEVVPEIAPFTAEQARIAGNLVNETRALGLSLGDRACLSLAIVLNVPVYTADRAWKALAPGIPIHFIR